MHTVVFKLFQVYSHKRDRLAPVRMDEGDRTIMALYSDQVALHQPMHINYRWHPTFG